MKTARWIAAVALGVAVGFTVALPIAAQSKKQLKQAQKLLGKIKLVDGAGSGLDADTLRGMPPSAFLGSNAKAADSAKLNGQDSSAFLGVNGKAADSGKLDGLDSTAFLKVADVFPRNYSCAGTTFWPIDSSLTWATSGSLRSASGLVRCNVDLPNGATVTGVSFSVSDSSGTDDVTFCTMWRTNMTTSIGTETLMADAGATSGTPGVTTLSTSTIVSGVIDNANFAYFVQCMLTTNVGLYGANISYTVTGGNGAGLVAEEAAPADGPSSTGD